MSDVVDLLAFRLSPGEEAAPVEVDIREGFTPIATMSITISVKDSPEQFETMYDMDLEGVEGLENAQLKELYRWAFLEVAKSMRMGLRRRKKGER